MSRPIFSRGFAGLTLTVAALALAIPALADENAQGPPSQAGPPPSSPAEGAPAAPHAQEGASAPAGGPPGQSHSQGSEHAAPQAQGPPADRPQPAGPNAADDPSPSPPADHPNPQAGQHGPNPHANAASDRAAQPETAQAEAGPPAQRGRVGKRSVDAPDLSGPPSEDTPAATSPEPDRAGAAPRRQVRGELRLPPIGIARTGTSFRQVGGHRPTSARERGTVADATATTAPSASPTQAAAHTTATHSEPAAPAQPFPARVLPRPLRKIVEVVPAELWVALAVLALLALALGASSWLTARRARRLRRQREALLQEVGLLQAALLPSVPEGVPVSAAYRPAEGPGAGGDFYEAFALADGRTGIVLGDVSGDGREALARTTLIRYTLRAYLEAGLEPREVVKVGAEALADHLGSGFATVIVAVHEPDTGRFTYSSAGNAPPVVVGPAAYEPVTACSAPPVAIGEPTGFRQSSFTLTAGSSVCLYTGGVTESRVDGRLFGVDRFERAVEALPAEAGAEELLERVADISDEVTGDMALCLLRAPDGAPAAGPRIEELEVDEREVGDSLELFLRACGVPLADVPGILREAGEAARREGSATVRVRLNDFRPGVDVVPGNLVRLEERRRAARARL